MKPTLKIDGDVATLTGDAQFVRDLLGEAKRTTTAQLGSPGLSSGFRAALQTFIGTIDGLLAQVAAETVTPPPADPLGDLFG